MGGIWKPAGRSRYRIWYKDHNGARRTAPGFKDKKASEAKLQSLEKTEEKIAAGLITPEEAHGRKPLPDLIERYIADLKRQGCGQRHQEAQEGFLRRLASWEGWTALGQVRHASMTGALVRLNEKGYSPNTLNHYRGAFFAFLGWCVDNALIDANPLLRVKRSQGKARPRKRRAPTMQEWLRLLDTAPYRRSRIYFCAGLTGLRKAECRELERRDVDLDHDPPQLRLRAEATKGKRPDVVPLLPDVVPVLKELCAGLAPTDRVFRPMPTNETVSQDIAQAGILSPGPDGRWVNFHSLRYFFCTLVARTLPIHVVRILMRHKDISTTCRIYLDLGLEDINEEIRKLPSFLDAHPLAHKEELNGTANRRRPKT